jgi:hypothetical protein
VCERRFSQDLGLISMHMQGTFECSFRLRQRNCWTQWTLIAVEKVNKKKWKRSLSILGRTACWSNDYWAVLEP